MEMTTRFLSIGILLIFTIGFCTSSTLYLD